MTDYIILGMGSPSDAKAFKRKYDSLGGITIDDYLAKKKIKRLKKGPMEVSCHRTLGRAIEYANDIDMMPGEHGSEVNRAVAVLFGGLAFALPGIMSSETATVPIIGVPAYSRSTLGGGLDSTLSVYNLPTGTVVGGAPLHTDDNPSLDKAVLIAEKILRMRIQSVKLIHPGDDLKSTKAVKILLDPAVNPKNIDARGGFDIGYTEQKIIEPEDHFRIALNICRSDKEMLLYDEKSDLALQCRLPAEYASIAERFDECKRTVLELRNTRNTLYFGKPENAALFLARIIGFRSSSLRPDLIPYKKAQERATQDKYEKKRALSIVKKGRKRINEDVFI